MVEPEQKRMPPQLKAWTLMAMSSSLNTNLHSHSASSKPRDLPPNPLRGIEKQSAAVQLLL